MPNGLKFLRLTEKQKYLPCRDRTYTEMFFITTNNKNQPEPDYIEEAKDLCSLCPIMQECRAEGFRLNDKWAVLGGLSPADRADELALLKQQEMDLAA